jgi:hypothetical protein
MTEVSEAINDVLRGTVVHSPSVYSWFGSRSPDLPAPARRTLGPQVIRAYLLSMLSSQLYRDFYCRGHPTPSAESATAFAGPARERFVARLSAANAGTGCWSNGWTVRTDDGTEVVVERDGLSVWLPRDELPPHDPAGAVRLHLPNGSVRMLPGFYLAMADAELTRDHTNRIVRLYWNLMAEGAETFLRRATTELNRAQLAFRLKVLDSPARYARCDAGVLYIREEDYGMVAEIVARIHPDVAPWLKARTPAFTKVLAPGIGLAEDPGPGESFGQHRCRLLADGIIGAFERGERSGNRLPVVAARFEEEGLRLDALFLNAGSRDRYDAPPIGRRLLPLVGAARQPVVPAPAARQPVDGAALLTAAERIGGRFVTDAVWSGDRCNWISLEPPEANPSAGATYRALGPAVYGGTSGVAMFLSQLYAATGDDTVRRTARGAIRQSLSRADSVPAEARIGLFTGWTGIALAAARAAVPLGEPDLLDQARTLLGRYRREVVDETEFDVITGRAGAILALVVLRDLLDAPDLLTDATRLGDRLLAAGQESDAGLSWSTASYPIVHNLNGFSHGAAGAAHALVELFRLTGDERYRDGAENAFRYERSWFDADHNNWPNLLDNPTGRRLPKTGPFPFMSAWCHGAPGIALSRLRAHAVLGDETLHKDAAIALQTTLDAVSTALGAETGNFCLCHGLAGNADVLLHGWQAWGADFGEGLAAAHDVARAGIDQYGQRQRPWPCLNTGEESLPLMVGVAGIGYFYLRLRDPAVPSILLVAPDDAGRFRR